MILYQIYDPLPDIRHLPFKIIYTNNLLAIKAVDYWYAHSSFLSFSTGQSRLFLNKNILYLPVFSPLGLVSDGDQTKCELRGGGSPRLLNTFSNLFIVGCTLHT